MPVESLTLIGFMDEESACTFLETRSLLPDRSPRALEAHWRAAVERLGAPFPNAGKPSSRPIAPEHARHLAALQEDIRFSAMVAGQPWSFECLEIENILVWQDCISADWAQARYAVLSQPAQFADVLRLALPLELDATRYSTSFGTSSATILSKSMNLRLLDSQQHHDAQHQLDSVEIVYGPNSPLVHVVRYGGLCYLINGCHRLYALRKAGVTHVPCLVTEPHELDLASLGGVSHALLAGDQLPTCGHYALDRAYPVSLREVTRVIHVSWSETVIQEAC